MLLLDILMFLEPFGLLPIAPISDRLRLFLPSYKATRIIAEVMLESLPQCLLQSYILVSTMKHVSLGTDSISERALLSANVGGATFAEILPRSITISVVAMLKTWMELGGSFRIRTRAPCCSLLTGACSSLNSRSLLCATGRHLRSHQGQPLVACRARIAP